MLHVHPDLKCDRTSKGPRFCLAVIGPYLQEEKLKPGFSHLWFGFLVNSPFAWSSTESSLTLRCFLCQETIPSKPVNAGVGLLGGRGSTSHTSTSAQPKLTREHDPCQQLVWPSVPTHAGIHRPSSGRFMLPERIDLPALDACFGEAPQIERKTDRL